MEIEKIKGGNCDVIIKNNTAKKIFRNNSSHEKIERFKRELLVFEKLREQNIPNLVKIIEVKIDNKLEDSYVLMKRYSGSLENIVQRFKGNVIASLSALLKIIKCLNFIYKEYGIVHRDIKPNNILFEENNGEIELFITDFGICYLMDSNLRLTQEEISMGARNYMAPEYEIGKVENVTEKGDIYSLGKILWYMVNGNPNEIFPSFVYFIDEYNLSKRFNNSHMDFANYIISLCVDFDQSKRANYDLLIKEIENYLETKEITQKQLLEYKAKSYSAKRNLIYKQNQVKNVTLVNLFLSSFAFYVKKYAEEYGLHVLNLINSELSKREKSGHYESIHVLNNTAHYLFNSVHYDNVHFQGDYNSGKNTATVSITYGISNKTYINNIIKCYYKENLIMINYKDKETLFSKIVFDTFLIDLVKDLVSND